MLELPRDLTDFLQLGRRLQYSVSECECGIVELLPLGQHKVEDLWVDGNGHELSQLGSNPNGDKKGNYAVPSINLVASCQWYSHEHVLSWMPDKNLYITWDSCHGVITSFPNVTWEMIAATPIPYLNAQWDLDSVGTKLVPWPDYPFRENWP